MRLVWVDQRLEGKRMRAADQWVKGRRMNTQFPPRKISNLKVDQGLRGLEVTEIPSTKTGIISFLRP